MSHCISHFIITNVLSPTTKKRLKIGYSPVDVVLAVRGQVVVDDQGHLGVDVEKRLFFVARTPDSLA